MSPIWMSPSRKVLGSRLGSSWVVIRISPGVVDACGSFWKLTVNGSGCPVGMKPLSSAVNGPVIDARPASWPALLMYWSRSSGMTGWPLTSWTLVIWNDGGRLARLAPAHPRDVDVEVLEVGRRAARSGRTGSRSAGRRWGCRGSLK